MTTDLLTLAADAIAAARRAGATAAQALAIDGRSLDVGVREGKVEQLEQSEAREVGLRIFVGQSSASIAGSVVTPDGLARMAERAVAMAKLAPPDPYAGLADEADFAKDFPDLDLVSGEAPDAATLKASALAAEESARAVAGVTKSGGSGASYSDRALAFVTSNGFSGAFRRSGASISATAISGEGTGMERDYDYSSAIYWSDLLGPEDIGRSAGERAVRRANPRKIDSQAAPVIVDRRVSGSLVGHLVSAASGSAVARGMSFLKDKRGEQIFAKGITIRDDPLRRRGLASRPFDGDGLPSQTLDLVSDGVLVNWLLDLHSARQLGLRSTGNCARSMAGGGGPSPTNIHMKPGPLSPADLMADIKSGLLITSFIGSGGNPVTGDYSRGASGFWIENGKIGDPVSEITVAGRLQDMFLTIVPANDLEFRSSMNAPTCRVEGLTLGGR
ncbi:TldD/PmbA family protein [soil metagenome]